MAGDRALPQAIQSSMAQPNSWISGAEEQRRIGDASGDDDVGAACQRFGDRSAPR